MGIHGIPYFINGFHCSVYGSIKTNGKIGADNVFINGTSQPDTGNIKLLAKFYSATE